MTGCQKSRTLIKLATPLPSLAWLHIWSLLTAKSQQQRLPETVNYPQSTVVVLGMC